MSGLDRKLSSITYEQRINFIAVYSAKCYSDFVPYVARALMHRLQTSQDITREYW